MSNETSSQVEAQAQTQGQSRFKVLHSYKDHLATNVPPISPPLAAVLAITDGLSGHNVQTASEGLSVLSTITATLKSMLRNPIPVAAGTDTFRHQLVTQIAKSTETSSKDSHLEVKNFEDLKKAAVEAGKDFVLRGIEARASLGASGKRIVSDGATVIIPAPSKAVAAVLEAAAASGTFFNVIFVGENWYGEPLSAFNIPVIHTRLQQSPSAYQTSPTKRVIVMSGASALLSDGSIMAAPGTWDAAVMAAASGREFWVAAELFKCVRHFQHSTPASKGASTRVPRTEDPDFEIIPAKYITGILTERGPENTNAISEEIIRTLS